MDAKFFDYVGDNRVISKEIGGVLLDSDHYSSLTALASVASIQPFRPVSELTGEIELEYNATIFSSNYCMLNFGTAEIPKTKNYFITNRIMQTGSRMILQLRCDVLTTFRSAVLSVPVVCRRTACGFQSPYIFDERAPVTTERRVRQTENTSNLAAYSDDMILITVG